MPSSTLPADDMEAMAEAEEFILTITANGYGKISFGLRISQRSGRGGPGDHQYRHPPKATPERNGPVVASFPVRHGSSTGCWLTDQPPS